MIALKLENNENRILDMIQSCTHSFSDFNSNTVYCMTETAYKETRDIIADVNVSYIVLEESEN